MFICFLQKNIKKKNYNCSCKLKPIDTHPAVGEAWHGKAYGSCPDPFLPSRTHTEIKRKEQIIWLRETNLNAVMKRQ